MHDSACGPLALPREHMSLQCRLPLVGCVDTWYQTG